MQSLGVSGASFVFSMLLAGCISLTGCKPTPSTSDTKSTPGAEHSPRVSITNAFNGTGRFLLIYQKGGGIAGFSRGVVLTTETNGLPSIATGRRMEVLLISTNDAMKALALLDHYDVFNWKTATDDLRIQDGFAWSLRLETDRGRQELIFSQRDDGKNDALAKQIENLATDLRAIGSNSQSNVPSPK